MASFPLLLVSVPLRDSLEGIFLLPVDAGVGVVVATVGFGLAAFVLGVVAVGSSVPEACTSPTAGLLVRMPLGGVSRTRTTAAQANTRRVMVVGKRSSVGVGEIG